MTNNSGWFNESRRHALASQGIKTGTKVNQAMPKPKLIPDTKKPENIDVWWHFEELILKKDLDDDDWYHARTNQGILNLIGSLRTDLEGFVEAGEGVSKATAKKAVDLFEKRIQSELKKDPKDEPYDTSEGEEEY